MCFNGLVSWHHFVGIPFPHFRLLTFQCLFNGYAKENHCWRLMETSNITGNDWKDHLNVVNVKLLKH